MLAKSISEDKYERILRAALRVFSASGVDGTAVPAIAHEAGVGVGTLYRYFENKEALVNALFRETKLRLKAHITEGIDFDAGPESLFSEFWSRLVDFALNEPEAFEFLELQDHLPYLDVESRHVEMEVLAPIWQMCSQMQEEGAIGRSMRPDVMIAIVWGAFVGLFKARRNGYLELTTEDIDAARDACWLAISGPALRQRTARGRKK